MMTKIEKHNRSDLNSESRELLYDQFSRYANGRYLDRLEFLEKGTLSWAGTLGNFTTALGYTGHYSTANYAYNYLYYANQLSKVLLYSSLNDRQPVTLQIANKTIHTIGKFEANDNQTGAMNVVRAMELALILRDKKAIEFYLTIPFEFTEKARHDDIVVEIILGFFQLLLTNKAYEATVPTVISEINKHLVWDVFKQYVRKTDFLNDAMWHYLWGHRCEKAEFLYIPLLKIYHHVLTANQTAFDQAVYEALQSWQKYYTKKYVEQGEEFDRSFEPEGYWAIPVIAACAFAHDRGMSLQAVESDYLSEWMIKGDFSSFDLLIKD